MKDQLGGKITTEFAALREKMYVYRKAEKVEEKRCKGTKKCVVSEALSLMFTRPSCLMVKQYAESKCCLRTRSMTLTRLISIR